MSSKYDDLSGRLSDRKTTSHEDNTQKEDNLTGRETLRSEEDKRRRKKGSQAGNLPGR